MGSLRSGIKIFVSTKKQVNSDNSVYTTTFRRVSPITPTTPAPTSPTSAINICATGTKRHRLSSVFSRQDSQESFKVNCWDTHL